MTSESLPRESLDAFLCFFPNDDALRRRTEINGVVESMRGRVDPAEVRRVLEEGIWLWRLHYLRLNQSKAASAHDHTQAASRARALMELLIEVEGLEIDARQHARQLYRQLRTTEPDLYTDHYERESDAERRLCLIYELTTSLEALIAECDELDATLPPPDPQPDPYPGRNQRGNPQPWTKHIKEGLGALGVVKSVRTRLLVALGFIPDTDADNGSKLDYSGVVAPPLAHGELVARLRAEHLVRRAREAKRP